MSEDNTELFFACAFHETRLSDGVENGNATTHVVNKFFGDVFIYSNKILFFVIVAGTKNFVHNVTIIREKDKAFGGPVQAADGKNAARIIDVINDVVFYISSSSADDAGWFIEGEISGGDFFTD